MASVNKVIIVGNLGKDPEVRYMPSGEAVANVSVATTDKWKDKQSGEMKEATEWHRISFFGRLAEIAGEYLKKGSQVYIEGNLRTRKYNDKDGVEKYVTEIRADEMKMLGGRPQGEGGNSTGGYGGGQRGGSSGGRSAAPPASRPQQRAPAPAASRPASGFDDMDDDIPF